MLLVSDLIRRLTGHVELPDLVSIQQRFSYTDCSITADHTSRCVSPECGPAGSPVLSSSYPEKEQENSVGTQSPSTTLSWERSPLSTCPVSPLEVQDASPFPQSQGKAEAFLTESDFYSRLAMLSEVSLTKEIMEHQNGRVFTNGYSHAPSGEEAQNGVSCLENGSTGETTSLCNGTIKSKPVRYPTCIEESPLQSVASPVSSPSTAVLVTPAGYVFPDADFQLSPTQANYNGCVWYAAIPLSANGERRLQLPSYQPDRPSVNGVKETSDNDENEENELNGDCEDCVENINGEVEASTDSPVSDSSPQAQKKRRLSESGPYQCELCGDPFTSTNLLGQHMRVHTMSKPFTCNYCQKNFTQRSHLTRHLYTHTGEKPHKCPHCERSFARSTTLSDHINTHTHSRPHKCWYCDKAFNQKSGLRYHIRTHTGERPFDCPECSRSFISSSQLVKHICRSEKLSC